MTRSETIRFLILRSIGNFLVLFALYGVAATFGPALYFEVHFRWDQLQGVKYQVAEVSKTEQAQQKVQNNQLPTPTASNQEQLPTISSSKRPKLLIPASTQFGVLIPKIGANVPVFPNVDSSSEKAFLPILQKGIAHAKGTVFPGMAGNIYLFAHSTDNFWDVGRYNAVFYLLKDLGAGDDIVIFFENRRHNYKVVESKIVDSSDVSYLVNSQSSGSEKLILQTCWPPGTAWKRLLVIAQPK